MRCKISESLVLRRWSVLAAVVMMVAVVGAGRAFADDAESDPARQEFEEGRRAYDAQRFDEAITHFTAAQTIRPSPFLDYNIGLALEALERKPEALERYRRYLQEKPDAHNRREVERRIAALTPEAKRPHAAPAGTDCPEGQVAQGQHCCWLGQIWSERRSACAGVPQCSAGFAVSGETCVASPVVRPPVYPQYIAPPPPPPGTYSVVAQPMRFVGAFGGRAYHVKTGDQACTTPCNLELKTGYLPFEVSGPRRYKQELLVPAVPSTIEVETYSKRAMITGVSLLGGGLALTAIGIALMVESAPYAGLGTGVTNTDALTAGAVLTAVGFSAALGVGVPFLAARGRDRLVVKSVGSASREGETGVRLTGLGVRIDGTGAAARAGFSF